MADDVPACIISWRNEAKVSGRFCPANRVWRVALIWILCDNISGEAAFVRYCISSAEVGNLRSPINDDVLDEAVTQNLGNRSKESKESGGFHHGRHFEEGMVVIG